MLNLKVITATILMAHGDSTAPSGQKKVYNMFAYVNENRRPLKKNAPMTMQTFPEDPRRFIDLHPSAYGGDAGPVQCRVSKIDIEHTASCVPARGTNRLLRGQSAASNAIVPLNPMNTNMDMNPMQMMQMMLLNQQGAQMMNQQWGGASGGTVCVQQRPQLPPALPKMPIPLLNGGIGDGSSQTNAANSAGTHPPPAPPSESGTSAADPGAASVADDIDAMLDGGMGKKGKGGKAAKPKKTIKKKPASAADVYAKNSPPPFGGSCPVTYNGCKIYERPSKFLVMPAPSRSKFDKSFTFWNDSKKNSAGSDVLSDCKNPSIPKDSPNYVKL